MHLYICACQVNEWSFRPPASPGKPAASSLPRQAAHADLAEEIQIERAALERALEQAEAEPSGNAAAAAPTALGTESLWVDRYRPRVYFDLLSDEATNRDLLRRATRDACFGAL